jgi:hypothetical protein
MLIPVGRPSYIPISSNVEGQIMRLHPVKTLSETVTAVRLAISSARDYRERAERRQMRVASDRRWHQD